jgi:hypothetical protein
MWLNQQGFGGCNPRHAVDQDDFLRPAAHRERDLFDVVAFRSGNLGGGVGALGTVEEPAAGLEGV